ncbi:MAG: hypothetical protein MUC59_19430 [Saprospiraceae bacterium]|jgi:hypothetical protein|nr:hypothetical protein [Saprospiraceae bacterium]
MRIDKYLLFFLVFVCASALSAQETIQPKQLEDPSKGIVYNQEFAMNFRMHTRGLGFGISMGKLQTYYRTKYWLFELGELKHSQEYKQRQDTPSSFNNRVSKAFKYGKQNNLIVARLGMGAKRYFSEKAKHKGVAVGISYEAGATLGILKPYYLELSYSDNNNLTYSARYTENTAESFLDINDIHGGSAWTKGLNHISLLPGAHARFSVHFDWGAFDEYLKSFEGGIMVDAFVREAPIMVEINGVENNFLFLNLFLNLQFGKRW